MKIPISANLLRHYLRNVYFINGHSCAGKSTMVRMLSERFGLVHCGENYHDAFPREKLSRWEQPGLCYFDTMSGWQEWLSMTPEEHWHWTEAVSRECVEVELLELVRLTADGSSAVADTNIPPDVLREISDYRHVAIMLCDPPDACSTRFFDRDDPDKQFMLEQIQKCPDPDAARRNFDAWTAYHPETEPDWHGTGFFTLTRTDFETDTREETFRKLAEHFDLGQK